MAESSIVVALHSKRDEIEDSITFLEGKLAELRASLVHVNAVLPLFDAKAAQGSPSANMMRLGKVFGPGEYLALSLAAIAAHGAPMTTSELAAFIMDRKGWDRGDLVLRRSLVRRLTEALQKARRRGSIASQGQQRGVTVWALKPFC